MVGTVGDAVIINTFHDLRGNVIASFTPGQPTQKSVFDGAGRDVMDYTTDGGAVNNSGAPLLDYADAGSVAVASGCGEAGSGAGAAVRGIHRSAIAFAAVGGLAGAACTGGGPGSAVSAMAGATGFGCETLPVGSAEVAGAGRAAGLLSTAASASAGEIVTRGGST